MFIVTISWYRLLRSRLYGTPVARMASSVARWSSVTGPPWLAGALV